MQHILVFLLITTMIVFAGCSSSETMTSAPNRSTQQTTTGTATVRTATMPTATSGTIGKLTEVPAVNAEAQGGQVALMTQNAALADASMAQAAGEAMRRKIIRNAEFTLESDAPAEGQRRIAAIAEARGGFVVTSEAKQSDSDSGSRVNVTVTVVVRVPSTEFGATIEEIRGVGTRVRQEKITGQDVTEEYVDLEARIRTQRALEAQFFEIMKQARKVTDALEVQRQLAEVRTEIERLEGRRRFLENQSSLSTITVTLAPSAPIVAASTSGFFYNVKQALGDGVDVAAAIILGLIRLAIALIPVVLFIVLPIVFLWRVFAHRSRRTQKPDSV